MSATEEIVARLRETPKYGVLAEETLTWAAEWALARERNPKEALKSAKRKLHQIYGAYVDAGIKKGLGRVLGRINGIDRMGEGEGSAETARAEMTRAEMERRAREGMALHASSAERLPILEAMFGAIAERTWGAEAACKSAIAETADGEAHHCEEQALAPSVVDLACGLNPLALPWMQLPAGARYVGMDIDRELCAQLDGFAQAWSPEARVECRDVLRRPPEGEYYVALLLKSAPCLDQQEPGATLRLLQAVRARCYVVTFPTRSLGGRGKGMEANYAAMGERLFADLATDSAPLEGERLTFDGELVFLARHISRLERSRL